MKNGSLNRNHLLPLVILILIVTACTGLPTFKGLNDEGGSSGDRFNSSSKNKNYLLLKRERILDTMGFDQPVEAMSILLPEGWKLDGSVTWKGINECRAEIVQQQIRAVSPDGEIEFDFYPNRSFVYTNDPQFRELITVGANSGNCQISEPFDASEWIRRFANDELNADVENVSTDQDRENMFGEINAKLNSQNRGQGPSTTTETTFVNSDLNFSDGRKGVAQTGVSQLTTQHPNYMQGGSISSTSTNVFYNLVVKFPPERRKEALEIVALIVTSSRTNPVWNNAKTEFLTKLGNIEHAGRMERIRLVGEQSRAYARERDRAMDEQMRSWERRQASSDASHERYIRSIREVEVWRNDAGDPVELTSGYKYGYSRPDGSYILTDDSRFDPAIELKENWKKMDKIKD